jgi:hypothetical protein
MSKGKFLKILNKFTVYLAQNGPAQRGQRARGALTRAPGRNLGLGRESRPPPGQKRPVCPRIDRDRPIEIDGRASISAGQNPRASASLGNPSHSLLSPGVCFLPRTRARATAGARVRRKVSAPPWSGVSVAPRSTARRGQRLARPPSVTFR